MGLQELYAVCTSAGFRVDESAGTVDGISHGIAWRLLLTEGVLDIAVRVSDKRLQMWQRDFAGGQVCLHGFGVRLTAPNMTQMTPEALLTYLDGWTAYAEGAVSASFDNKFQRYGDPPSRYLRGALGAFLGALVGVIPWVLGGFLGFRLWILGFLISVAAFYGYQRLGGAHATGFAVGAIVVSSLLAVFVGQVFSTAVSLTLYSEVPMAFSDALRYCLAPTQLVWVLRSAGSGLLCCALGFVGIRGKVMEYTHSTGYLRRRK